MKKIILTIILLFISIGSFSTNSLISMGGEVAVVYSNYELTSKDRLLVNKFVNKFNKNIQKKGTVYKNLLIIKIDRFIKKGKYPIRLITILEKIKSNLSDIVVLKEQEEERIMDKYTQNNTPTIINNTKEFDINMKKVRREWLGWYNNVRDLLGKERYSYDSRLDKTALEWSKFSKEKGEMTHKRNLGDSYYDYNIITGWFKERSVVCKNINRATNTENIGWGGFYCNDGECSDELLESLKNVFDMYMDEKGTSYDAHYRSVVHSYFTKIGMGLEIEKKSTGNYKFYVTTHYCTELN